MNAAPSTGVTKYRSDNKRPANPANAVARANVTAIALTARMPIASAMSGS